MPKAVDFLGHELRQWEEVRQDFSDVEVSWLAVLLEGCQQGIEENGPDLCACESFGDLGQLLQVEIFWLSTVVADHDFPDGFAFVLVGQVHEEDLVEPAFSEEFRWKLRNVVGGGDDEYRGLFLLHPVEERAKHTR